MYQKKHELIVNYDGEYEGTKQGINLPVYFSNDIVGVIGITGKPEEISKYAKIIQSMTEILVKEAYILEQEKIARESTKQFVEELLFRRHKEGNKSLEMRSELLNIKIDIPRTVIVARIYGNYQWSAPSPNINEKIYNLIKRYVEFNSQNIIVQSGVSYIIILDIETIKDLHRFLENIHNYVRQEYKVNICFGIGSRSNDVDEIKKSYTEAEKALNVALSSTGKPIIQYSELDIRILIDEVPQAAKIKFNSNVFKNIDGSQLDTYIEILTKYFENNGSINKTASELFLHKNTLQYKLNKIKALTGYDPRNMNDLVVLYLAVMINKLDK